MRIQIHAVGRLKSGPERTLVDHYLDRCVQTGRSIGIMAVEEKELDPRHFKTKSDETRKLVEQAGSSRIFVLDEMGHSIRSSDLSKNLQYSRDEGISQVSFLIGGSEGHVRDLLPSEVQMISFGRATWPHMLVRVMLAEQIYRSISLMAGLPYHREG